MVRAQVAVLSLWRRLEFCWRCLSTSRTEARPALCYFPRLTLAPARPLLLAFTPMVFRSRRSRVWLVRSAPNAAQTYHLSLNPMCSKCGVSSPALSPRQPRRRLAGPFTRTFGPSAPAVALKTLFDLLGAPREAALRHRLHIRNLPLAGQDLCWFPLPVWWLLLSGACRTCGSLELASSRKVIADGERSH